METTRSDKVFIDNADISFIIKSWLGSEVALRRLVLDLENKSFWRAKSWSAPISDFTIFYMYFFLDNKPFIVSTNWFLQHCRMNW